MYKTKTLVRPVEIACKEKPNIDKAIENIELGLLKQKPKKTQKIDYKLFEQKQNNKMNFENNFSQYIAEVMTKKYRLNFKEQKKLAQRMEYGDTQARDELIESNLGLVISIAKYFQNRGLELEDLVQEGNRGLIKGVTKWDYRFEKMFSTYVTWWIRQAIGLALDKNSTPVTVPAHYGELISRIRKCSQTLEKVLERKPTCEEIAQQLGWSTSRVEALKQVYKKTFSLDYTYNKETNLGSFIEDKNFNIDNAIHYSFLRQNLFNYFYNEKHNLSDREVNILMQRSGLKDGIPKTLKDVGKQYNIGGERVRQIESRAKEKLRSCDIFKAQFKDFWKYN